MSIEWLAPWQAIAKAEERAGLLLEFQKELPSGHILSGKRVIPIGRRYDCDDVLFSLDDERVAIVHLTWSSRTEPNRDYPRTIVYSSFEQFADDDMKPAHQESK